MTRMGYVRAGFVLGFMSSIIVVGMVWLVGMLLIEALR